jgi:TonB-dependent receptor
LGFVSNRSPSLFLQLNWKSIPTMLRIIKTSFVLIICSITLVLAQEKGKISGKVQDAGTSEELIGVAVGIKGTSQGSVTDIEGNYSLSLEPGTYTLVVNYVGYKTKEVTDVVVTAGQTTDLKVTLEEATVETEEVVVTATFKKESVDALMLERKNAVAVSDGVSADLIKKTPDRSTSDVMKRVSGASIQDNKYAIIRGLNERYNTAMINGSPLPSTEPDRKAFSFDIFPASLLESMTITKTATPDMPGEFAGGVIKLKTRDIPDKNFFTLDLGTRYNTITNNRAFSYYEGGKYDRLGLDDGTRKLPSGFPSQEAIVGSGDDANDVTKTIALNETRARAAQMLPNNWEVKQKARAPWGSNLQATLGRTYKGFGLIAAITYNRNVKYVNLKRTDFDANNKKEIDFNDDRYNDDVMLGGLLNMAYKINQYHLISFKNTYNVNSQDQMMYRTGEESIRGNFANRAYNYNYSQNNLYSTQLGGEHFFSKLKLKADWVFGYSKLDRIVPDYRTMRYQRDSKAADSIKFQVPLNNNVDPQIAGRFHSKMREDIRSFGFDVSRPLPTLAFIKSEVKVGVYIQSRERKFSARQFGITLAEGFSDKAGWSQAQRDSLLALPINSIFSNQNFNYFSVLKNVDPNYSNYNLELETINPDGSAIFKYVNPANNETAARVLLSPQGTTKLIDPVTNQPVEINNGNKFTLKEDRSLTNSYDAASDLKAAYFMLDHRFDRWVRMTWGFRVEGFEQRITSYLPNNDDIRTAEKFKLVYRKTDWLPSVNLTISPLSKLNVRTSFYKTVNRPEFRELAPFRFFDFVDFYMIEGNVKLERATINNYDVRLEFFPGAGQVISASFFYKQFTNPIERVLVDVSDTRNINFLNAPSATNRGVEFDLRQNLMIFAPSNKILQRITISGNYARIASEVNLSNIQGLLEPERPLQGQSNYLANIGVNYIDEDHGYSLSAMGNRVGRRIAFVGSGLYASIWENPRTVIDLQATKLFWKKRLEAKITVSDLLAQKAFFYQDIDNDKKFKSDKDQAIFTYTYGTNVSFTMGLRF